MDPEEYRKLARVEANMWWFVALRRLLLGELSLGTLPIGSRVLDAGCGTGGMLAAIRRALPGGLAIGLDLDVLAAELARNATGAAVVRGSIASMPFATGSLQAIVSADVLCHADVDVDRTLSEFRRCLAAGGLLALNLPAYPWLLSTHDRAVSNTRRFTYCGLKRSLEQAGFCVEAGGYWNSLLFPLMVMHRLASAIFGSGSSDVRQFSAWQNRLFTAILGFESRLRAVGIRMPFGGSLCMRCRKPA
ncbi:class I SAM-dependent methyltransferase [Dongia sedimenti]|uniref:Class I SAM-dependent methyltransferase n=1 Tax=Dongia sedimenti TaxID=3064282 RepID=A0ABU0YGT8_9PROT|nr:class I SAM-dependent methyltransferase [Rhodospirillaceae bacterium R-7]